MCEQQCYRQQEIDDFIEWCAQPYDDYIDLTTSRAEEIGQQYFAPFRSLTSEAVCRMLRIMRSSIELNPTDRAISEWKGCCVGVADYLFRPSDLDGVDREACARALQRFSGWYHTRIALWARFRPVAEEIGNMLYDRNCLRYLKIGEEWTFGAGRLDQALIREHGFMFLWHFAQGIPNSVRTHDKLEGETRTLASRLLNFRCRRLGRL